jgi:metal-responsive CopG/Arc/MetJ family transcriptional regulator
MKKKLIGVYLPISLISRLKTFIMKLFIKTGEQKTQSDVVEEAVKEYLDKREGDRDGSNKNHL